MSARSWSCDRGHVLVQRADRSGEAGREDGCNTWLKSQTYTKLIDLKTETENNAELKDHG